MVDIFQYAELKGGKVFSRPKHKSERYDFKDLEELKGLEKGKKSDFALVYGQEKRLEGKRILAEAKQRSEKMIEDAGKRVLELEKEAYDKGKDQAFEDGKKKLEPVLAMFQQKLEELFQHKKEIFEKSEEEILDLVLSLASKIINYEVKTRKEIILGTIKKAADKLVNREQVVIRINPEDMEYVLQNKPELKDALKDIQQVSFKEDASISKGGAIIDTSYGSISAIIEKEFEELEKVLRKEFETSKENKEQE